MVREVHRSLKLLPAVPDKAAGMGHTRARMREVLVPTSQSNHASLERTYYVACCSNGKSPFALPRFPLCARHCSVRVTE